MNPRSLASGVLHVAALASLTLSACGRATVGQMVPGTPEYVASHFATSMSRGDSDRALDDVCSTFVTVLPTLHFDWSRDGYSLVSKDGAAAEVRMIGESRITEKEWKQWSQDLQVQIPQLVSVKVTLNYTWHLQYEENRWCITKEELGKFIQYFIGEIRKEIPYE